MSAKNDDTEHEAPAGAKKKGGSPAKWAIIALVLGAVGPGVWLYVVPKFVPKSQAAPKDAAHAEPVHEAPPISVAWPPLVVDVHDDQGTVRHVKIIVTLESQDEKLEVESRAYTARGRAHLLGFVRKQKYEDLVDSAKFEGLQTDFTKIIQAQMGAERIPHVWITDLVAQ